MQTIFLTPSLEDEYQKAVILTKMKRFNQQRKVKNKTSLLIIVSLILIMVAINTGSYVLYPIMIVFLWAMFGLSNIMDASAIDRTEQRLRKNTERDYKPSYQSSISFDNTGITFMEHTPVEKTYPYSWSHFIGYNDSGDILLLVRPNQALDWPLAKNEMGEEVFNKLKCLVQEKLPTLKNYYAERNKWWHPLLENFR